MSLPQQLRGVATSFHIMNECQLFGRLLCPRIFHQKGIFVVKFQPLRNRHSHGKDFAQWKFTLQRSLLLIQSILYYQNSTFIWKYLISWTLQSWCTVLSILVNPMPISVLLNAHCIAVHWSTDCIERRKDRRQDGWTCWSGAKSFFPPRLIPIRRKSDWKGIRRRRQRKIIPILIQQMSYLQK